MGGEPYWYFVNYNADVDQVLRDLRDREFRAGRYNPVMHFIDFPLTSSSPAPGPGHSSIKAALKASLESGTRSILDIEKIATQPRTRVAVPLDHNLLMDLYGTTQPDREMVENNLDFLDWVERGHCVYFTIYKDDEPHEILFAGYSFD